MKRDDIALIAQLLNMMKDTVDFLSKAKREKNLEKYNSARKEILHLSEQVDKLL